MSFPGNQAFDVCNTNEKIKEYILKISPNNQNTCELTKQHHRFKAMPGIFEDEGK
jgi:hypothetical protein